MPINILIGGDFYHVSMYANSPCAVACLALDIFHTTESNWLFYYGLLYYLLRKKYQLTKAHGHAWNTR